jgi:hypothetical protein
MEAADSALAKATRSRTSAERVVAENTAPLERAERALQAARGRVTELSSLVAEVTKKRLARATGVLQVATAATDVAADVAGVVAPIIEALDPLAAAMGQPEAGNTVIPVPGSAEHRLRLARAEAIRDQRAAAQQVASRQHAADTAARRLAVAHKIELKATATAAAAADKAETLVASLGIDKRLVWPGAGPVASPYGMRSHPVTGAYKVHTGVDFEYADGLAYSAAEGTVLDVVVDPSYGNLVTIAHGRGITTRYAHLAAPLVDAGEHVSAGQVVGRIGSTGLSTGPHLHFEIRMNGRFHNPAGWLGG